jgi:hypothetical protein
MQAQQTALRLAINNGDVARIPVPVDPIDVPFSRLWYALPEAIRHGFRLSIVAAGRLVLAGGHPALVAAERAIVVARLRQVG